MTVFSATARVVCNFNDPAVASDRWTTLLRHGETDTVFLTWTWQRVWWEVFGRGQLLLVVVEREGEPIAITPLFRDGGMVFFVSSGGSDYLEFIGDTSEEGVLEAILDAARSEAEGFVGFRFYHLPDRSQTGKRLQRAAAAFGLACFDEGELAAPVLEIQDPADALAAASKKSLLRHERGLAKSGALYTTHICEPGAVREHLNAFFQQHIDRWAATSSPSLFQDAAWRTFYTRLTEATDDVPWLRFTRVDWNERLIAFHFGFYYRGEYLWYKPTFDIALARQSPGEVLLRQLLLAAIDEGARAFDFGLGEESFKLRFATHVRHVRTWGLYPPEVVA